MELTIRPEWRPADAYRTYLAPDADPETALDEVSTCALTVAVGSRLITRMVDDHQQPQDGPTVSAFRLAEWFSWNWWRLPWEPSRSGDQSLS